MPWSINSLEHEWIDTYQGQVHPEIVARVTAPLIDCVHS